MALLTVCESAGARARIDGCATFACSAGFGCNAATGADAAAFYILVCRHSAGNSDLNGYRAFFREKGFLVGVSMSEMYYSDFFSRSIVG